MVGTHAIRQLLVDIADTILYCCVWQAESLRNLIVSEVADWQVLTLRLAVQVQALKNSTPGPDGNKSNYKQVSGVACWFQANCISANGKIGVLYSRRSRALLYEVLWQMLFCISFEATLSFEV